MKYPYSSPNFGFFDLVRAMLISHSSAERRLKEYFSTLTGKKYILITNSCRTALHLTYKVDNATGEIISSPLTCKVAIDPIVEAGFVPVFADIHLGDLNINPADIEHRITSATRAIQVIHLGGISCKMDEIHRIAKKHNLLLVEDCAQALGAKFNDRFVGSFGDIACFSLIKNGYGIGGGILATDDAQIFEKASELNKSLNITPKKLIVWRVLRNLIASYRNSRAGNALFKLLLGLKGEKKSYHSVTGQLYRLSPIETKIAAYQSFRYDSLHKRRKQNGLHYYQVLNDKGLQINNHYDPSASSFTKLFVYNPLINSKVSLKKLHSQNIEAMHLEEKSGSPYQKPLIDFENASAIGLNNFLKVHDSLVSLPLCESYDAPTIEDIFNKFSTTVNHK
jgi:dTDP-4-amino-4,6-dideoxygalactose transaminase